MNIEQWFTEQGYKPATFQKQVWKSYAAGNNGLLIAPTGSGKTYAIMGGIIKQAQADTRPADGLRVLWITPLRALAGDIAAAAKNVLQTTLPDWEVALRTGDTSTTEKRQQRKKLPEVLVTTPESVHVILSYGGSSQLFKDIDCVVVDEWHELLGSKRGVMMQLALAHLHSLSPDMRVWGMSATIGNPNVAADVLLTAQDRPRDIVYDKHEKRLQMQTLLPETIDRFPWSGHMGDVLLPEVLEVINSSRSTLIFTNTRNQAENWYRKLLAANKDLAGKLALHHGSLSQRERAWVETALHEGRLQAVVATSSLDLGVDFRPVDTVVQIGGSKGIARFLQRAGRSGHAPGETSSIYFVPTNSMEIYEAAALQTALAVKTVETIVPPRMSLDVLTQWLVTLGVGDGFEADRMYKIVKTTDAFAVLTPEVWRWALEFVSDGGAALGNYENYRKLTRGKDGTYKARNRQITNRHRLAIGAITSTSSIPVQVLRGSVLGSIDESFAASLKHGQTFWFSGRALTFLRVRDNKAWVRASTQKRGITPAWAGGRLPFSSQLALSLREQITKSEQGVFDSVELRSLQPLTRIQASWSAIPQQNQLLIEQFKTRDGYHTVMYPFEGRAIHEVLANLLANRLGAEPNTFSFAFNDYGFEIVAANPIDIDPAIIKRLLSTEKLDADIAASIKAGSLPRRRFRSIAVIAGLINSGRPGKPQSNRHLQASSEMIYDVLTQYDPDNKLLQQAYDEVLADVIDIDRLRDVLQRLQSAQVLITNPPHIPPFAFPLVSERFRERLSTETYVERLQRMQLRLERYAKDV